MDAVLYGLLSSKIGEGGGGDEGAKKYQHNISIIDVSSTNARVFFSFIDDVVTPYETTQSIAEALGTLGFTFNDSQAYKSSFCSANGMTGKGAVIYGVTEYYSTLYYMGTTNFTGQQTGNIFADSKYINDTVIEL